MFSGRAWAPLIRDEPGQVQFADVRLFSYIGLNILCGAIWAPFTHLAA